MAAGPITLKIWLIPVVLLMAGCATPQTVLVPERIEVLVEKPIAQDCPKRGDVALPDIEIVPPGATPDEKSRITVKNYLEMQGYAKQLKGTFGC